MTEQFFLFDRTRYRFNDNRPFILYQASEREHVFGRIGSSKTIQNLVRVISKESG